MLKLKNKVSKELRREVFKRIPERADAYAKQFVPYLQSDLIEEIYDIGEVRYEDGINRLRRLHPEAIVVSSNTYHWNIEHRSALAGVHYMSGGAEYDENDGYMAARTVENERILLERSIKTELAYVALTHAELHVVTSEYFRLGAEDKLLSLDFELQRGEKYE